MFLNATARGLQQRVPEARVSRVRNASLGRICKCVTIVKESHTKTQRHWTLDEVAAGEAWRHMRKWAVKE